MKRRYPLHALKTLRSQAVTAQGRELGERITRATLATRQRLRAETARKLLEEQQRQAAELERQRLEQGSARALDLQTQDAWQRAATRELEQLKRAEDSALRDERAELGHESAARAELGQRFQEARVVERHEATWEKKAERRAELSHDELNDDAWSARALQRGKP